jgi:hypothetical protein
VGNGYREADLARQLAARVKALGGQYVAMMDGSLNPYDTPFDTLGIDHDYQLLELHLDAYSDPSAKGGHVIIKTGYQPDGYDNALAAFISSSFPGRSHAIRNVSLKNANKAAAAGYAYRLLEVCFITNATDVSKLVSNLDEVATGILTAFGIEVSLPAPLPPVVPPPVESKLYRVRTSKDDASSQIGAYRIFDNAVAAAKAANPYRIYDEAGTEIKVY